MDQRKQIRRTIIENMTLKEKLNYFFGVDLPISGGKGQSIEDPIIIDVTGNGVAIEYQVIDFIQQLGRKTWHMERQELIRQKDKPPIDKISIVLDDDPDNYHNYYFDISKFY